MQKIQRNSYASLLGHKGFFSYLLAEALGAFNDNYYKLVISLLAIKSITTSGSSGMLAMIGAIFIFPYLVFSGLGGALADRYAKRSVLVFSKLIEIVAMGLACLALSFEHMPMMIGVLFFTATQSALNSPAKYGIIPEMVTETAISKANSLVQMTTYMAIILGTAMGGFMLGLFADRLEIIGFSLIFLTIISWLACLNLPKTSSEKISPASLPEIKINTLRQTWDALRNSFFKHRFGPVIFGISWFWLLGALLQMALLLFGKNELGLDDFGTSTLLMYLLVGIALGSLAAGFLSGSRIELGLVPTGLTGVALSLFLLGFAAPDLEMAIVSLMLTGFSAGLFIIPLNAFLQYKADIHAKGETIAASNVVNTVGMLLASVFLKAFYDGLGLSVSQITLVFGLLTLLFTAFILRGLAPHMMEHSRFLKMLKLKFKAS